MSDDATHLQHLAFSAQGTVERLAFVMEEFGEVDGPLDELDWLDTAGRLSVWARDTEEVPRLLFRLAEYLERLRDAGWEEPLATLGADYLDSFERSKVRDLRAALEHHGDYVAGVGRRKSTFGNLEDPLTYSYTMDPFVLRSITVFGTEFDIEGPIEFAFALRKDLKRLGEGFTPKPYL